MNRQQLMVLIVSLATLLLHVILAIAYKVFNVPTMTYIETAFACAFFEGIVIAVEVGRCKTEK